MKKAVGLCYIVKEKSKEGSAALINRKTQWTIFLSVNGGLLLLLLLFPLYEAFIMPLPQNQCEAVTMLHIYCPGCGGTRAFQALLSFDILESLRLNPIALNLAVGFIAYEIYMTVFLFKKTERRVFFGKRIFWVTLVAWGIYFLVRNILLFCGIDLIGDVESLTTPSVFQQLFGLMS